jgi:6-phosphofructo-2-kinase / fructose-2,6-biphosphatase 4
MGVKTQVISLGDYRRKVLGGAHNLPKDYFTLGTSTIYLSSRSDTDSLCVGEKSLETEALRRNVKLGCEALIWDFFEKGGQVVIYDANNGTIKARQELAEKFDKAGVHVVFLGSSTNSFS